MLKDAIKALKSGGLIIFPTETVYGLGADIYNRKAIQKIYRIKKREKNKSLPIIVASVKEVTKVAKAISPEAKRLMKKYFPGPLTIVLKKRKCVPAYVTADGDTIAVRCPNHPLTLKLLRIFGRPIVGTSANLSGKKEPKSASEAKKIFGNKVDYVLDGGKAKHGIPSTVVDATSKTLKILRLGPVHIKKAGH